MGSSAAGSSAEASALHSSMVKLFTRRAAAHVELHDLASAKADLAEVRLPASTAQRWRDMHPVQVVKDNTYK